MSAINKSPAPVIMEMGISFLLSGPVTNLTICGTRRPTKPMIPETETEIAASSEPVTRSINVTILVFTPRLDADRSPREIRLRSLAKKSVIMKPATRKISIRHVSNHVLDAKLPISQKIMTETCSSAEYFKKLIPAESMAPTMIPDKIRLLEDSLPMDFLPEEEKKITKKSVEHAPVKAKSGTETIAIPKFKKIAIQAPNAAPAEIPSVYGSASGFKRIPWKTAPDTDRAPPTAAQVSILGSLTSMITSLMVWLTLFKNSFLSVISASTIFNTSVKLIFTYPMPEDISIKDTRKKENRITRNPVLFFDMALTGILILLITTLPVWFCPDQPAEKHERGTFILNSFT